MAHIVRIDGNRMRDWQVHGFSKHGYHSRLFSDGMYSKREKAKAEAETYKQKFEQKYALQPLHLAPYFSTRSSCNTCRVAKGYSEDQAFQLTVEFRQIWKEAADQGAEALRQFWAEGESG
jgi:hypothetical protein